MPDFTRLVRRRVSLGKAYQNLFDGPDGRLVLVDLMRVAGMLEAGSLDPQELQFQNGKRTMILHIMEQLRMDH